MLPASPTEATMQETGEHLRDIINKLEDTVGKLGRDKDQMQETCEHLRNKINKLEGTVDNLGASMTTWLNGLTGRVNMNKNSIDNMGKDIKAQKKEWLLDSEHLDARVKALEN